jgi:Zn-dependent peptidase ImmA (M78 family)
MGTLAQIVGKRLENEIARRGLCLNFVADNCGLPPSAVNEILSGESEINLKNITSMCSTIHLNIYRLLSKDYTVCKIHFRNVNESSQDIASQVEDAFLILRPYLPTRKKTPTYSLDVLDRKYSDLIVNVLNTIQAFQSKFGDNLYSAIDLLKLPVFQIYDDFDGFFLDSGNHCAICVNTNAPPVRIRFSLAHELAHFLFDKDTQEPLPVETWKFNPYKAIVEERDISEFMATKFAQYFLVPFKEAEDLWQRSNWPDSINLDFAQWIIDRHCVSIEVLANVFFDMARINGHKSVNYRWIKDYLASQLTRTPDDHIWAFLRKKKNELLQILEENQEEFSGPVFQHLKGLFQL